MLKLSALPACTLTLCGCIAINESDVHPSNAVYQVQNNHAQQLPESASRLTQSISTMCILEDDAAALRAKNLDNAREQWQNFALDWMKLQGQERGPQAALDLSWNIQFWPDKKNTTGRQLSGLIKSDFNWNAANVSQQGVAVKGMGALEWMLFDSQYGIESNQDNWEHYCLASQAISQNIEQNSMLIATAWQQNPWLELSASDWQAEYLALMVNQLDYTMKKLSRPLDKIGNPKPYFSESWRAKTSMNQMYSNVEALQSLYLAGDSYEEVNSLYSMIIANGNQQLAVSISEQLESILENWPNESSLFDLLQSKEGYRTALSQYNKLDQLKYLLAEEAAIELGIVVGFNATDGD